MVVPDAPALADALLPAAARVAPCLVVAPDDCLPALADAEAGWPALLAAAVAWVQLVVARVVQVVTPLQASEPRFVGVVPASRCARSARLRALVQEARAEAEAAGSQPPVGSSPRQAALHLRAGQLP
jgi:hypothetical protein